MSVKAKADAIDRFVRTLKETGVYDDVQAACIMAGWTNLAGALTPLKGAAPTNVSGLFQNADLDPGIGLKGDGSSKYLQSATPDEYLQDDAHVSAWISSPVTAAGYVIAADGLASRMYENYGSSIRVRMNETVFNQIFVSPMPAGHLAGMNRDSSSEYAARVGGINYEGIAATSSTKPGNYQFFGYPANPFADATLSWYSIGSATDLAALDSAVSTLMADLRAIDEAGFDRDALAYIRSVEAADGSYLETGVKQAINAFVVGCKADGIWDAIKASCIMCGARTISGALVPLVGTAPTAVNFVSGNYNRSTGLVGVPAASTYIDTNRANNADGQNDNHNAVYVTTANTQTTGSYISAAAGSAGTNNFVSEVGNNRLFSRNRSAAATFFNSAQSAVGFLGTSRSVSTEYIARISGSSTVSSTSSDGAAADPVYVFARSFSGSAINITDARLAFYSIGASLSLESLDNRVSTLVAAIAAAI